MFIAPSDTNFMADNKNGPIIGPGKRSDNDAFFDTIWSDQMYLDAIAQYKDKSWYQRLIDENPHLRSKNARFETDPLTGMFNYGGAANAYYSSMRSDAMDWLSRFVAEREQEETNSPVEQAKRLAQAGINPDLSQNVDPGQAAENDNIVPASYHNGSTQTGMEIAQAGLSFIGNILSFGQSIQALNVGSVNQAASELTLNKSVFDQVVEQIAGQVDIDRIDKPSDLDAVDIAAAVKKAPLNLSGISRRGRKFFNRWMEQLSSGDHMAVDAVKAELRNRILRANKDSAEIMSSPYYSKDFNQWISNLGTNLSSYIAKAEQFQAMLAAGEGELNSKFFEENKSRIFNLKEGELSQMEGEQSAMTQYYKWKSSLDSEWNKIVKGVQGDGKHWYNTIGVILLHFLRSQIEGAVFHGSSSKGLIPIKGPGDKTIGYHYGKTGSSFGF